MATAKLSIDLEARVANLQQGLDKAVYLAEKSAARMDAAFAKLGGTLATLGAGLSAGALAAWLRTTVDGVDKLNDMADATGATVENLSALEDVAVRTGTSVDTAADAVVKLNKALNTASDPESNAAKAFRALGLSVDDLKRQDPVQALQQVGVALQGFANDGNKGRIIMELLGKSTREIAPLLKDLAEVGKLVATVTTREAEEAERFNKELFALQKNSTDAARALSGPMIAALNATIEKFREGKKEGKGFWDTVLEGPRKLLDVASGKRPLSDLASRGGLIPLLDSQAGAGRGFVNPPLVKPQLPTTLFDDKAGRAGRAAKERPGIPGPPLDPLEAFRLSELAAQSATDETLRTARLTDMERERADAIKAVAEQQKRLDDLLAATPTAKLENARADMILLAEAFEKGTISAEQFNEAATARLGDIADEGKRAADEWTVFADQAARNIQDTLGDTLEATMSGNFRSIGDLWKRTLDRMVAEALAAKLGQALLGDFGKTGNVGGLAGDALSWLGTLFPSARGNAFVGGHPVHAFAAGGLIDGPTLFPMRGGIGLAGEAGTEAILPLKRGASGRLGVEVAGGAGPAVTIHQHITAPAGMDRASRLQLMADVGLATQRAIARNT